MPSDSYSYFDHDADVGVIGRGSTLEHAFEDAARAMFAIMIDISALRPEIAVRFTFEETDVELALVTWLNLLLAHAREQQTVFSHFYLQRDGARWYCEASGQRWQREMERGVEVKGATLTMLAVEQTPKGWEARCVVDV